MIMPSHLPDKPRAKTITAKDPGRDSGKRARTEHPIETIDWLAIWSLSIGFCAAFMAAIVVYNDHDNTGASVILAGAAGIIALVLFVSEAPRDES